MPFTLTERPESTPSTLVPPTFTSIWLATGEVHAGIARANVIAGTPGVLFDPTLGTLYRRTVDMQPDGHARYIATLPYAARKRQVGSYSWNFDTSESPVHITCAKEHIATYNAGGLVVGANPHGGMIGVNGDEIAGCDIPPSSGLKVVVNFRHPTGVVNLEFVKTLSDAKWHTNLLPYLDFDAGELLFSGATGSDGSESEAEISYQFLGSPNVTDLAFGGITGVAKKGWEYAWVEWEPGTGTVDGRVARDASSRACHEVECLVSRKDGCEVYRHSTERLPSNSPAA